MHIKFGSAVINIFFERNTTMKNLMTKLYIGAATKLDAAKTKLAEDERGVAPIVATILIMLIVVLLVAVFYDKLSAWFKEMMDKIFDPGNTPSKGALS